MRNYVLDQFNGRITFASVFLLVFFVLFFISVINKGSRAKIEQTLKKSNFRRIFFITCAKIKPAGYSGFSGEAARRSAEPFLFPNS